METSLETHKKKELNEKLTKNKAPFELRLPAPYHFTGRSEELKKLEELIFRNPSDRKICAIFGSAGFGKSALAYHFAESQKEKFADGVLGLRVDGKDVDTIARDFARLYGINIDSEDERDAVTIMKDSFSHRKVLLIFDNVDEREIDSLLNLGNNCSIILTTRDRRLPGLLGISQDHRIELLPLIDQDSQDFFEKLIGKERFDNEKESAYNIIKYVGNVPLAIRIIGAILETQDWLPLLDFERSLSEEKTRLSKLQISKDKDLNVQASIALSLNYLLEEDIKFFACLSVCAESGFSTYSAIAASGYDESFVNEHLGSLRRLCLIDLADPKKFVFHPLVLLFAKDLANKLEVLDNAAERHARYYIDCIKFNDVDETLEESFILDNVDDILLAAKWLSNQEVNDFEPVSHFLHLFDHYGHWKQAVNLISSFLQRAEAIENWVYVLQLIVQQARYLSMIGELPKAEEKLNLVPEILVKIEDKTIHQRLEVLCLNVKGNLLKRQGKFTEAKIAFSQCSELVEKRGNEHELSIVLTSMGDLLLRQGQLKEAKEAFQRSASIEENIGNQHGLGKVLTGLGKVLLQQGELEEAKKIFQSAYNIFIEVKNLRGQSIAMMGLGNVLQDLGRLEEAKSVFQKTEKIEQKLDNKRGQSIVLTSLGGILQKQGRLKEAEERLNECLKISEDLDDKRSKSFVLNSLGGILQQQGRLKEAEERLNGSLKILESLDDKRQRSIVLTSLGGILQQQGRLKEAEERLNESLKILESLDDKRQRSIVLTSLGGILQQQGRLKEAEEIFSKYRDSTENHTDKFVSKKGTVKRIIRHPKGYLYGFIYPDDRSKEIYFREGFVDPQCLNSLKEGSRVECGIKNGARGLLATNMKLIS